MLSIGFGAVQPQGTFNFVDQTNGFTTSANIGTLAEGLYQPGANPSPGTQSWGGNALADLANTGVQDEVSFGNTPYGYSLLCVAKGNGDGTFAFQTEHCYVVSGNYSNEPSDNSYTNYQSTLFTGDFNNDGNTDIGVMVGTGPTSGTLLTANIIIFNGNGDGTLSAGRTVYQGTGLDVTPCIPADFNNDGNTDLLCTAVGNPYDAPAILFGTGTGTFGAPVVYSTFNENISSTGAGQDPSLAYGVGDFNHDGHLDVAAFFGESMEVYLGSATGALSAGQVYRNIYVYPDGNPGAFQAGVGPLVKGGNIDIVFPSNATLAPVGIFAGNGDGTFSGPSTSTLGALPTGTCCVNTVVSVAVSDVNQDGYPDMVLLTVAGPVVYLGSSNGTFTTTSALKDYYTGNQVEANYLQLADLNGSGADDIFWSYESSGTNDVLWDWQSSSVPYIAYGTTTSAVAAAYVPSAAELYPSSTSNTVSVAEINLKYNTPPVATISAGAVQSAVKLGTYSLGSALTSVTNPVTIVVTGPAGYSQSYTVTTASGVGSFTPATLTKSGTYTYTAYFTAVGTNVPTSEAIATQTVSAGVFSALVVANYPSPVNAGTSNSFSVSCEDTYGNVASCTGTTINISLSDPAGVLSLTSYTFTVADGGVHFFNATFNTAGTQSITATGNAITGSQTGIQVIQSTIGSANFVLTSSLNPSAFGQTVTFTATFSGLSPVPTGTLQILDGATVIGTALVSGSTASFSTSSFAVGTHSITAFFPGNSNYAAATSNVVSQEVIRGAAVVMVSGIPNPSAYTQTVTITVAVTQPYGSVVPTGTVALKDGSTSLSTVTINSQGIGTFTINSLSPGSHMITGTYSGDTNYH